MALGRQVQLRRGPAGNQTIIDLNGPTYVLLADGGFVSAGEALEIKVRLEVGTLAELDRLLGPLRRMLTQAEMFTALSQGEPVEVWTKVCDDLVAVAELGATWMRKRVAGGSVLVRPYAGLAAAPSAEVTLSLEVGPTWRRAAPVSVLEVGAAGDVALNADGSLQVGAGKYLTMRRERWTAAAGLTLRVRWKFADGDVAFLSAGPVYYVDSVGGSDGNNGLSADTAKQTIGGLPALGPGTTIYLARGSHWREQLTVAVAGVSVLAYGSGAKPLIDCSDTISAGAWSKTGGQTHVYQATVNPALASQDTWVRAWENNGRLVRASSVANCDATAGSYYPSADTGAGPITLYVHASDGSNPASSGKTYEYNARRCGIYSFGTTSITITGIHTRRNLYEMGSLMLGDGCRLTDVLCEDGSKHNLYYGENSVLTDVEARDAYYTGALTYFVGYKAVPTGGSLTHVRCRAVNTTGSVDANATGFHWHSSNKSLPFGAVRFEDCYAEKLNIGMDTSYCFQSLAVDGLELVNCNNGIYVWHDAAISGLTHTCANGCQSIYLVTDNVAPTPAITLNLADSTLTMAGGAIPNGGMVFSQWDRMTVNLDAVHFVGQDNEYAVALMNGTDCAIRARGCDFETISGAYRVDHGVIDSDYNRFRDWIVVDLNGTNYNGVAAWQAAGQDAHSTVG